jgi:hypothetical protein
VLAVLVCRRLPTQTPKGRQRAHPRHYLELEKITVFQYKSSTHHSSRLSIGFAYRVCSSRKRHLRAISTDAQHDAGAGVAAAVEPGTNVADVGVQVDSEVEALVCAP